MKTSDIESALELSRVRKDLSEFANGVARKEKAVTKYSDKLIPAIQESLDDLKRESIIAARNRGDALEKIAKTLKIPYGQVRTIAGKYCPQTFKGSHPR